MNSRTIKASLSGLGLLLTAASAGGCAFGDRMVNLNYKVGVPGAYQTQRENEKVSIGKFESLIQLDKKGRAIVGCVRNGYGWKTAQVLSPNSPADWLRDAFSLELTRRGYKVYNEENKNIPKLEGEITHLYADLMMNYHTNVSFTVKIKQNNKTVYTDAFNGNASPLAWFAAPGEYENALNESLERALSVAVPKIVFQLEEISKETKKNKQD